MLIMEPMFLVLFVLPILPSLLVTRAYTHVLLLISDSNGNVMVFNVGLYSTAFSGECIE